jgi:hypothetical protein
VSFDIYAIVPASSWPSFKSLNDAMSRRGYPAALQGFDEPNDPVQRVPSVEMRYGLTDEQIAEFGELICGALVDMNGELVEPDFNYQAMDAVTANDMKLALAEIGASDGLANEGDVLVTHSGHSVANTWNAGVYPMCSLIYDFDGYGFEFQGGAHGREDFAAELFDALDLGENDAPNQ